MNENVFILRQRFHEFTSKVGLNSILLSARPDPTRDNALILKIQNNGARLSIFDHEIEELKVCLQGEVFDIHWGQTNDYTEFGWRPVLRRESE